MGAWAELRALVATVLVGWAQRADHEETMRLSEALVEVKAAESERAARRAAARG